MSTIENRARSEAGERIAALEAQIGTLQELLSYQERTAIDQTRKLEAALDEITEYTEALQTLGRVSRAMSAELDAEKLVQTITEAGTELSDAAFGAFFYNVVTPAGEALLLWAVSGASREDFAGYPMPRATAMFGPTFRGEGVIRLDDVRTDPRFGKNPPYNGLPPGHLPVRSYLAVPVISRSGEPIGGLFFAHPEPGRFTGGHERLVVDLAAQAAIAIDNARLYDAHEKGRAAAEKNEKRYRSLVFANPTQQAVGVADPDGNISEDSPTWRSITGQTFEEMRGRGWLAAIHPDDRERVAAAWDHAIATREVFEQEYRLRRADGVYRWFAGKGVPVYGTNAMVTEWMGTATDVNERRIAEEGLKFLATAGDLLATTLDYEATLRNLTRIAVPKIADWCAVDMVEGETCRRLAVAHVDPQKLALAQELQERYPPQPDRDPIFEVIRSGRSQMVTEISEELLRQFAPDEEWLRIVRGLGLKSWMIVPLKVRGRVVGAVTFVTADSGRVFSQFELAQAEEFARRASLAVENARLYGEAQEASRAKDNFLATLSHELRTPMTAILGWARMLKMGLDASEMEEALHAIEQSALAQSQIIEDILDVSRVISGKLRIDSNPVTLGEVCANAVAAVRPAATAKGVVIREDYSPDAVVLGDGGRLQQVVWNLVSNAMKFTSRGGSIDVRTERIGSHVRLVVSDTGKGIDASFLPHIFEPFRQAEGSTTREHGGLGLGLAIVRYLVELHGGKISVRSEGAGEGTTFTAELPWYEGTMHEIAVQGGAGAELALAASDPLPSLGGIDVLVIDDQPFTREFLRAVMRHCGAQSTAASSVREALAALGERPRDVIVCDIAMPGEDGFAFLRHLRSDAVHARIPVIALTAFGRNEDREHILAAGFDGYLRKPVEPLELANTIAAMLRKE